MKKLFPTLILLAVIGAGIVYFLPDAKQEKVDQTSSAEAKKVEEVKAAAEDRKVVLSTDNTAIDWKAIKTVVGKKVAVTGGWDSTERDGKKGQVSGEVLLDAAGVPRQIRTEIAVGTLWTEHDALTGVMFTGGFFDIKAHPSATFASTAITAGAPAGTVFSNATHTVEGNLTLNGIAKSISFPALVENKNGAFSLLAKFGLNRQDFNCKLVSSPAGVLLGDGDIDNTIAMTIKVEAGAAAGATAGGAAAGPAKVVDVTTLAPTYKETIPASQISFDMVLVKGDASWGIKPFYFGAREVTWDEFMPWVTCQDVKDPDEHGKLRGKKLRPSMPYTDVTRGFGINGFPALSMSKLSAELYCKWLSAQTGKNYRLPTEREWSFAYAVGRGTEAPLTAEEAKESCVYEVTSFDDNTGDYATRAAGIRKADKLGLFDLAGNVCEWVTDTGKDRVARGGHFQSKLPELGSGRHVEDMDVWNMNYPNEPKSIWWFVDARWVGFRVVCDP